MLTLIGYESGKDDQCITSSFGLSKEAMTSRMAYCEEKSKSRKSCELGESIAYASGVG
jgi:hypothetical protein